jgi:hypothetical protein
VCVVDPPRKGLEATLLAALCRPHSKPQPPTRHHESASDQHSPTSSRTGFFGVEEPHGRADSRSGTCEGQEPSPTCGATPGDPTPKAGRIDNRGSRVESGSSPALRLPLELSGGNESELGVLQVLIYLSCGFAAFKRDCSALLLSGQWELHSASAFLFFPGTDSLEVLAVFRRPEMC